MLDPDQVIHYSISREKNTAKHQNTLTRSSQVEAKVYAIRFLLEYLFHY